MHTDLFSVLQNKMEGKRPEEKRVLLKPGLQCAANEHKMHCSTDIHRE